MSAMKSPESTPGKREARRELRMHSADEEERRTPMSVLPAKTFEAFKVVVDASGKRVPGLAAAARASEGRLKDAE